MESSAYPHAWRRLQVMAILQPKSVGLWIFPRAVSESMQRKTLIERQIYTYHCCQCALLATNNHRLPILATALRSPYSTCAQTVLQAAWNAAKERPRGGCPHYSSRACPGMAPAIYRSWNRPPKCLSRAEGGGLRIAARTGRFVGRCHRGAKVRRG